MLLFLFFYLWFMVRKSIIIFAQRSPLPFDRNKYSFSELVYLQGIKSCRLKFIINFPWVAELPKIRYDWRRESMKILSPETEKSKTFFDWNKFRSKLLGYLTSILCFDLNRARFMIFLGHYSRYQVRDFSLHSDFNFWEFFAFSGVGFQSPEAFQTGWNYSLFVGTFSFCWAKRFCLSKNNYDHS